jgi:2,3-dihydroxy-p-cumate/2,3-dihydroxybenzoate 3,4-dioxygenase
VARFIEFRDLTGNRVDLAVAAPVDGQPFVARRDAGITGFSHVGLCTTDAPRDEAFWCGALGARVSDRIGEAALLRIDPVHHKVALFPATRAGIQHVNHQVASVDDVMRSWYFLRNKAVRVLFGPGRHPTSGATFLYFQGPDGMTIEYPSGVRTIAPEEEATYQPRQFPHRSSSFCMWGAVPYIAEFAKAA